MKQTIQFQLVAKAVIAVALVAILSACDWEKQAAIKRDNEQVAEGQKLESQGLNDAALAAFTAALNENPKLIDAEMGVGDIYRKRGDMDKASEAYAKAAQLAPTSFDAHYYLGLTKQLMGQIAEAVDAYLRAVAIKPNNFDANANLASAYLQLNRPADALPYAQHATELKAKDQGAWANLATIHNLLGQYDDAVDAYRRAAALGDLAEPILLGLADSHIKLEHYDRANAVLQTLIRRAPSSIAYERLGYSQFRQRRFDDALASFRAALSMDRNDVPALNGVGVCLMTLYIQSNRTIFEQRDQALEAWIKSLKINPNQPKIIDLVSRYQKT